MEHSRTIRALPSLPRAAMTDYILDMIAQMARLARHAGELHVAIHLEAIIAAQRAIAKDSSA